MFKNLNILIHLKSSLITVVKNYKSNKISKLFFTPFFHRYVIINILLANTIFNQKISKLTKKTHY